MKKYIILPALALFFSLFFSSCEKQQAAYEQGERVNAVIIKKYETGSNNPNSKGPRKSYYLDVQVPIDQSVHRVSPDRVTWNSAEVGGSVTGYFHEGTFVPAYTELER